MVMKNLNCGILLFGLGVSVVLGGCQPKPSLVGTWEGEAGEDGRGLLLTTGYHNEKEMSAILMAPGLVSRIDSTYTFDGKTLVSTATGVEVKADDPKIRKTLEEVGKKEIGQTLTSTVVFDGPDEMTQKRESGAVYVATRKK
jgi:hypothetical protein